MLLVGAPEEFVLVCFAGALELGNLAELARLFDANAAEDLVSAAKAVATDFQIGPNPSKWRIHADVYGRTGCAGSAPCSGPERPAGQPAVAFRRGHPAGSAFGFACLAVLGTNEDRAGKNRDQATPDYKELKKLPRLVHSP